MHKWSLTRQLVGITIFLLFFTAIATSLPAVILLQQELNRQVDLRLQDGISHTQAIWSLTTLQAQQTIDLASQRPTLQHLIDIEDRASLADYLAAFRADSMLDYLYVQSSDGSVLGDDIPDTAHFEVHQTLAGGFVIVGGIVLDATFLDRMESQTGYQYNFADVEATLVLDDNLSLVLDVDTTDIRKTQTAVFISIITVALFIAGLGSLFGGYYMRRRMRVLWRLQKVAKALGEGDFTQPVEVSSLSPEIMTLSQTLETSRLRISRMMDQLQQERDWSNSLTQAVIEGILAVNQYGVIIFCSDSTRQIMNWQDDCIGKSANDVFRLSDSEESFIASLPLEGNRKTLSVYTAEKYVIQLSVTRARQLPYNAMMLVLRDVTEEQRQQNAQAYYLANMSHEFRTPLSGMKASLELLIENESVLTRTERNQLHGSLLMSVSNLQRLIDNLLEGSKLQAQKFSLHNQMIDFEQVLVDALHTMQPLLTRHQQSLSLILPLNSQMIYGDRIRLVQVMVNLIANASKYSPETSSIDLLVQHEESHVWVGVIDQGIGVPEAQREAIFQQFVRVERDAGRDHGTGLGLSVVRGIIEAHQGQVGVKPGDNGGSIFWFTIPARVV